MADISALGGLAPVEPLDLENYADSKDFTPLPPKGEYVLQAPSEFPATAFGATKAGSLSVAIDPTIVGPTSEGYTIRFTKVSAKPFKRNGVTVSQLGDYLRAHGIRTRLSSAQEQADAVESTAGRTFRAVLDWRAYNKITGLQIEGMERFPTDGKGGYLPWYVDETTKDPETGEAMRLRANLVVSRFIAAE